MVRESAKPVRNTDVLTTEQMADDSDAVGLRSPANYVLIKNYIFLS